MKKIIIITVLSFFIGIFSGYFLNIFESEIRENNRIEEIKRVGFFGEGLGTYMHLLKEDDLVKASDSLKEDIKEFGGSIQSQKNVREVIDINFFEKKKECAGYRDEILKDIFNPVMVLKDQNPQIKKIFYSPVRNSCLYLMKYSPSLAYGVSSGHYEYEIIDFLTKEWLYGTTQYNRCQKVAGVENMKKCLTVNQKVFELE